MSENRLPPFTLFPPPYRALLPLDPGESFPRKAGVLHGTALVWNLGAGHGPLLLSRVAERPGGLPLFVILPPANKLDGLNKRILEVAEDARPQAVLPHHPHPMPEELASLLRKEPPDLATEFLDYLRWRGLTLDRDTRQILRRTVELSADLRTLGALARGLYLSRRALGRRMRRKGLPVPSHWLQFCRLLRASIRLQNSSSSLFDVACSIGYPDGFTLSNQMQRLVGVRPSVVRKRLGWEWFAEAWLRREWETGGLEIRLSGMPPRKRSDESGEAA